jgi:hypothetical protein
VELTRVRKGEGGMMGGCDLAWDTRINREDSRHRSSWGGER